MKKLSTEQVAMLIAILIGGTISVLYPEKIKDAFTYTVGSCFLIKLFF